MSTPFTLLRGRWYAAEFIGDEFLGREGLHGPSPIRIEEVKPFGGGQRRFELSFWHANYPEGVQDKVYSVQTIERGERSILVRSLIHSPARLLLIHEIDWPWLHRRFGTQKPVDCQHWLSIPA